MSKKTNKTSHVMDLLTNGASTDADSPVAEAVSNQEKKAADVQSHTVTPAKVTVVDEGSRNDRLSQEILGKLTEELEEETRQDAENRQASSQQEETPKETITHNGSDPKDSSASGQDLEADAAETAELPDTDHLDTTQMDAGHNTDSQETAEPDVSFQASSDNASLANGEPSSDTSQATADSTQSNKSDKSADTLPKTKQHPIIPESQLDNRFLDKEYRFVNVMEQLLMRQNLEAVLTQHNVCTCPRCMSDVCALVLTGLPSKYVVTSRDSLSPLISYYENKYKISVLTELMKACDRVRQNPRHKVSH